MSIDATPKTSLDSRALVNSDTRLGGDVYERNAIGFALGCIQSYVFPESVAAYIFSRSFAANGSCYSLHDDLKWSREPIDAAKSSGEWERGLE